MQIAQGMHPTTGPKEIKQPRPICPPYADFLSRQQTAPGKRQYTITLCPYFKNAAIEPKP